MQVVHKVQFIHSWSSVLHNICWTNFLLLSQLISAEVSLKMSWKKVMKNYSSQNHAKHYNSFLVKYEQTLNTDRVCSWLRCNFKLAFAPLYFILKRSDIWSKSRMVFMGHRTRIFYAKMFYLLGEIRICLHLIVAIIAYHLLV